MAEIIVAKPPTVAPAIMESAKTTSVSSPVTGRPRATIWVQEVERAKYTPMQPANRPPIAKVAGTTILLALFTISP